MFVYIVLLIQQVIASGTHIIAKVVVRDIDPLTLTALRSAIAAAGLLILAGIRGVKFSFRKEHLAEILLLSLLVVPVNQYLFLFAMKYTTPTNASLLYGTTPALVLLLSYMSGRERMNWKRGLGVFTAFCGICVIIFEHGIDIRSEYSFGNMILVVAVISWGFYTVRGRDLVLIYGSFSTSSATMILGSLLFLPVGAFSVVNFEYASLNLNHWAGVLYLAFGTSIFSYLVWYYALARIPATKVAIFTNLQPVFTTILAILLLGQPVTLVFLAGGCIALGGVVLTQFG